MGIIRLKTKQSDCAFKVEHVAFQVEQYLLYVLFGYYTTYVFILFGYAVLMYVVAAAILQRIDKRVVEALKASLACGAHCCPVQ